MAVSYTELRLEATDRYYHSARHAELLGYWSRLTGYNYDLLRYEEVASRLHIRQQIPVGFQMIPLNQIVGSVGRYREFTNNFLPRKTVLQERWIAVDITMNSLQGLPPIELYKVGGGYFVVDGNHRISVARANGNGIIEAYVIECQTPVPLTLADFRNGGWRMKAAYADFLAHTRLDALRPEHEIRLIPPEYTQTLLQHIEVHRYLHNQPKPPHLDDQTEAQGGRILSWEDAVMSWYNTVYLPIVAAIRGHRLQVRFPKRAEVELYVQITQYRERIAEEYGLAPLGPETAVAVFAANHSDHALQRFIVSLCQALRQRLRQNRRNGLAHVEMPLGMTEEEFQALRLRHDAGELSLTEASHKEHQQSHLLEGLCEGQLDTQFAA
jgi:hypothetical protein